MTNSDNGKEGAGTPRRRKRVITDARKEQNRIAQKLYRRRQKELIKNRENHRHDHSAKRQLRPRVAESTSMNEAEGTTVEPAIVDNHNQDSLLNAVFSEPGTSPDLSSILNDAIPGNGIIDELFSPSMLSSSLFASNLDVPENSAEHRSFPESSSINDDTVETEPIGFYAPSCSSTTWASQSRLASSNWPSLRDPLPLGSYWSQFGSVKDKMNQPTRQSTTEQDTLHHRRNGNDGFLIEPLGETPDLVALVASTVGFLYGRCVSHNHQASILKAYAANAQCIGMEFRDLLNMRSPFYRPDANVSDDPQALVAAACKPWIPDDLRPTLAQIMFPHHPYLDLLPFPALRARVIMFTATTPQLFDPMELKKDIFLDGLKYNRDSGQLGPWDSQSWEIAPWFLRQWRLLMG